MGEFDFKGLKEFLSSFQLMLVIALSTGLLLFLPKEIVQTIYLLEIREKYGTLIGIAFTLSVSAVLVRIVLFFANKIKKVYEQQKTLRTMEKSLTKLNKREKEIIKELTKTDDNTLSLSMNSGVVKKLESLMIIGKATNHHITSGRNPTYPYLLQPWVYDYLGKKPNYFDE